jgi:aspartyl-tRNA(Asn)/glutamyl-tRNA(Gln) amidotransferase subunit A
VGFGAFGLARNGLPMGVQIVGPLGADQTVLRAARAIEQALPIPGVLDHA